MVQKGTKFQEGIKTDYITAKIIRAEYVVLNGSFTRDFAIELIRDMKEYMKQTQCLIEEMEADKFALEVQIQKIQHDTELYVKLLECLGVTRIELGFLDDRAVEFVWKNADKKNVENIHAIGCLLSLAEQYGKTVDTIEDLKRFVNE